MRTTLALDDDVFIAVKEKAKRENRTIGQVLSDLARRALTNSGLKASGTTERSFYGFEPLAHRGKAVSNALIDKLREEDAE